MASPAPLKVKYTLTVSGARACSCAARELELPDAVARPVARLHRTFMAEASPDRRQLTADLIGQHLAAWCVSHRLPGRALDSFVVHGDRVLLRLHDHGVVQ